jgi:hypothetical protein
MKLPNTYTDKNETGCCPIPNIEGWRDQEINLDNMRFIRMYTRSFFFIPLNMGKVMTKIQKTADEAKATMPANQSMILSRDISPWRAEQLYAVSKPIDGADNVSLSGKFLTKVFEGPYQNAKKWYDSLIEFAKSKGKTPGDVYFFYTTCPKCAKHYGKNYTIGLIGIS